jgi:hypothetical protein
MLARSALVTLVVFLAACTLQCQESVAQQSLTDIPKEKRNALDLVIMFGDEERVAKEDEMNPVYLQKIKSEQGSSFMPYYAEGDFDGDDDEDFAIVHVEMGGLKDTDAEKLTPGRFDDWGVYISVFEADNEAARGFSPHSKKGWILEKADINEILSSLFIGYEKYLYYFIVGEK